MPRPDPSTGEKRPVLRSRAAPIARATATFLCERALFDVGAQSWSPKLSDELLDLMGCRVDATLVAGRLGNITPVDMVATQESLPKLLGAVGDPIDEATILDGMYRHECWRSCLETSAGTYTLATALLSYLAFSGISWVMQSFTKASVIGMLNEWLAPPTSWIDLPGDLEVCRHMFSAVWCDLALPDGCDSGAGQIENSSRAACYLAQRARPPFLPGLCREHGDILEAMLPSLDASE